MLNVFRPGRGMVLVKPIETAESLPRGKILLTERTRQDLTSHQMEVLAVGAPALCINPDCERPDEAHGWYFPDYHTSQRTHPCNAQVGDWVLVAHRSLSETDTDGIYIIPQDAILAILCA